MTFGLLNAPASCRSRAIDLVFSGLTPSMCVAYLDDVVCFSNDLPTHLYRLECIFQRLAAHNLKLKPSKCSFLQTSISYLGHLVSQAGVGTSPHLVRDILEWPACTNAKEIKVFLGLSHGYYRKYLKNYAAIVSPLTDLLQANTPFIWTTECQQAMNTIKQLLTTAPILALPRFDRPFILDTDCSNISMGSVLSQLDDDRNERVICYSSKKLTDRQKNYCVTRRELLAVIYYLKYYKHYLLGTKCL
jgi:hypothetical protein